MSWLAERKPRHSQRKPKKPGRPPKEGSPYHRININVDDWTRKVLKEKIGNKSEFIRSVIRPVLEQLDPGEASEVLWQIDVHIKQRIIEATQKGDFQQVSALAWIAICLEDARKLCGVPETIRETICKTSQYGKYMKELRRIWRINLVNSDYGWHELALFISCLPPFLKDEVKAATFPIANNDAYTDRLALKMAIDIISTIRYEHLQVGDKGKRRKG